MTIRAGRSRESDTHSTPSGSRSSPRYHWRISAGAVGEPYAGAESLILLAEEDLVQVFPQLGSFVARVDPARVREAQFVREAIELASLADAIELAAPDGIAGLREILARQRRNEANIEELFALDEQFHQALLAVGGHVTAWRTVHSAQAHLDRARRLGLREVSPVGSLIDQHTQIIDALERADLAATTAAMRDHLRAVLCCRYRAHPGAVAWAVCRRRRGGTPGPPDSRRLAVTARFRRRCCCPRSAR